MVESHPIELPPQLKAAMTPPESAYASMSRQAEQQRKHQAELNRVLAEQRLAHQAAVEAAREAAKQGRYH